MILAAIAILGAVILAQDTDVTVGTLTVTNIDRAAFSTPAITEIRTNRVEQLLSTVSSVPVEGKCPECGMPNHHNREVQIRTAYNQIYSKIVYAGRTSEFLVGTTPATNFVVTNLVLSMQRSQPGTYMPPPPLPLFSTNFVNP